MSNCRCLDGFIVDKTLVQAETEISISVSTVIKVLFIVASGGHVFIRVVKVCTDLTWFSLIFLDLACYITVLV